MILLNQQDVWATKPPRTLSQNQAIDKGQKSSNDVRTTNWVIFPNTYFSQILIIMHLSKVTQAVIITAVSAFMKSIKDHFVYNVTPDMYLCTGTGVNFGNPVLIKFLACKTPLYTLPWYSSSIPSALHTISVTSSLSLAFPGAYREEETNMFILVCDCRRKKLVRNSCAFLENTRRTMPAMIPPL